MSLSPAEVATSAPNFSSAVKNPASATDPVVAHGQRQRLLIARVAPPAPEFRRPVGAEAQHHQPGARRPRHRDVPRHERRQRGPGDPDRVVLADRDRVPDLPVRATKASPPHRQPRRVPLADEHIELLGHQRLAADRVAALEPDRHDRRAGAVDREPELKVNVAAPSAGNIACACTVVPSLANFAR